MWLRISSSMSLLLLVGLQPAALQTPPQKCKDFQVIDFSRTTVASNNLGGMGPNVGDPEEIRYLF